MLARAPRSQARHRQAERDGMAAPPSPFVATWPQSPHSPRRAHTAFWDAGNSTISVPTLLCSRHTHATAPGTCSSLWGGTEWPWLPGSVPMQLQLPAAGSPVPLGLCRRQARLRGASELPLCQALPVHVQAPGTSWRCWDPFPPQKHRDSWGALPGLSRAVLGCGVGMPVCILSHPMPVSFHPMCPCCGSDTSLPPCPHHASVSPLPRPWLSQLSFLPRKGEGASPVASPHPRG